MKKIALLLLVSLFFCVRPDLSWAETQKTVTVYFFWGQGCPHCEHEKPFLAKLKEKYPGLIVRDHEVWYDVVGREIYRRMAEAYGSKSGSVPATFIGEKVWIGYSSKRDEEIESFVRECFHSGCTDPVDKVKGETVAEVPTTVDLPLVGTRDAARISLPVLTVILAGLDGFNPCAFFVLLMLLSLMVHAQSRMRMLVVGGIFVFFSGFVYFLFMAAWLNLFMVTGRVGVITALAGVVALLMAVINIKDYFFFKQGVSLTMSKQAEASLLNRMRGLIKTGSLGGVIIGTIVLAVMANMYELLCTAGFPMVFTRVLTLQGLSPVQYYLYLVLYNVIYVIPLLTIVILFARTMGSRKLTEAEGRTLKLVSGLMMLGLGSILVFKPDLLNSIFVSVGLVFGVVIISAAVVWLGKRMSPSGKAGG